jgi:hypothetical protein
MRCLIAHVLESFSLTRFMRTLLVLIRLKCSLGGNISRKVARGLSVTANVVLHVKRKRRRDKLRHEHSIKGRVLALPAFLPAESEWELLPVS